MNHARNLSDTSLHFGSESVSSDASSDLTVSRACSHHRAAAGYHGKTHRNSAIHVEHLVLGVHQGGAQLAVLRVVITVAAMLAHACLSFSG